MGIFAFGKSFFPNTKNCTQLFWNILNTSWIISNIIIHLESTIIHEIIQFSAAVFYKNPENFEVNWIFKEQRQYHSTKLAATSVFKTQSLNKSIQDVQGKYQRASI